MKNRWAFKIVAAAAGAVGLTSLVGSPAQAANPPYSGCTNGGLCLYQDANGAGSKTILFGYSGTFWNFSNVYFYNGVNANDQVSSVWNRTPYCAVLYRNYNADGDTAWAGPGQKLDFGSGTQAWFNDITSSVRLTNC